jgi:hypothetical protein
MLNIVYEQKSAGENLAQLWRTGDTDCNECRWQEDSREHCECFHCRAVPFGLACNLLRSLGDRLADSAVSHVYQVVKLFEVSSDHYHSVAISHNPKVILQLFVPPGHSFSTSLKSFLAQIQPVMVESVEVTKRYRL